MHVLCPSLFIALFLSGSGPVVAQLFQFPTANRALLQPGNEEKFFVGTVGKPWTSGQFGCVRTDGWQMHEGLDIKCLQRDSGGEPIDPVLAAADGTVVYLSAKPSLSRYGNYIVLRHQIDTLEIYSLYAHLRKIQDGLMPGHTVKSGEVIATMGRTTNTREGISRDRAHVHFELDLLLNEGFPSWYKKAFPTQRNDHGEWNGLNLLGIDPRLVLLEQHRQGTKFNLVNFVRNQAELCRVRVRGANFPWLKRYPQLIEPNPLVEKEGVTGYDIALNSNGVPYRLIPRAASEFKNKSRFQLVSVNEPEYHKNPCRRLVSKHGDRWALTQNGNNLLELLTY